ncbi:IS5 family transposase, partial [Streptomyces roseus]|uniref:IS5 family transposase n=1 Tax=Streptomyces roseus TaxID=66430 RepID=UPI00380922FD
MIRRYELSDAEWELVQPRLPRPVFGRPWLDDRTVLNGIVWKFRTGVAWRDVPERYGSWASLHTRFRRWAADGTFERMLRAAQAQADVAGDIEWLVGGFQHRPSPPARSRSPKRGLRSPGLGRSRGGLTSKVHLAWDGSGRPL